MKIYLAFFQTRDRGPQSANYGFWAETLRASLTEAGHEVLESPSIDWASGMSLTDPGELRRWRDQTWSSALSHIAKVHAAGGIDLFLGYFFPQQIERDAVLEIQRMGIPAVNFFCDNVREFRSLPAAFQPFTLHWVPEWAAQDLYRKAGLNHLFAPMPAWVPPECRSLPERETEEATFLGSYDTLRGHLFGELAHHGGNLHIYGKGWTTDSPPRPPERPPGNVWKKIKAQPAFIGKHGLSAWIRKFKPSPPLPSHPIPEDWLGGPVSRADYLRLSKESAITVGVNRFDSPRLAPGEIATYSRLRDLEAPMLGACYLTEWAPELDHLYDLESEIATYRSVQDLDHQIKRLLADPERRRRMRHAAQQKALTAHTVSATMEKIRLKLGL